MCPSTIWGHPVIFTTSSAETDRIKGPITYFCCSATASLSASGSVATTTLAFSFSASLSDNSWWEEREGREKNESHKNQINPQSYFLIIRNMQLKENPICNAHCINTAESQVLPGFFFVFHHSIISKQRKVHWNT